MTSQVSTTPVIGAPAPDFTLASTAGTNVTLSSFRDDKHVLLAFFPLAFTSTCTAELCDFSEGFDAFSGAEVEVLPISVDAVPSLKEFRRKYDMKVTLLSDMKREVSRAYGVLLEEAFIANRAYFLIDKAGVLRWAHVDEHPGLKRENAELLAAIASVTG